MEGRKAKAASCGGEYDFAFLHPPRGVAECLQDVFALEIRVVDEEFVNGGACADFADDHAHGDAEAADAGLAAHDAGILYDAIQCLHSILLTLRIAYAGLCLSCGDSTGYSAADAQIPYGNDNKKSRCAGVSLCHALEMRRQCWLVAVGYVFLGSMVAVAQERGQWRAASTTARAITGDVAIGGQKISINFVSFTIAQIKTLDAAEVSAVFNLDTPAVAGGQLYRLDVPGSTRFQHKNTLCGSEDTQWMVTTVTGKTLQLAFFSGTKMPVFTGEAMAGSTDLCGTFMYVK
jgi:hypothetical protein